MTKHRKKKQDIFAESLRVDLSHLKAAPLRIAVPEGRHALHVYLVGCGGTGSWLAPHIVRLARFLQETRSMNVQVTFVDPDVVEMKNVFRQSFGEAEVGGKKAELLALRHAASWGISIQVHDTRFEKGMVQLEYGDLGVIVGCVDNAAARRSIADTLTQDSHLRSNEALPRLWWLDCGNGSDTGQVLFGGARSVRQLRYAFPYFPEHSFCVNLPAPDLQHPDLLEAQPEERKAHDDESTLSCADLALAGDQSPSINATIAIIAATYLWRLFADPQGLTAFATYCNLGVLSARSCFITPQTIAQVLGKNSKMFKPRTRNGNKARHSPAIPN